MLEVMIRTVFLKSTVRPWPSVRRPSSITCRSVLKTSRVGLLDLVQQDHRVGPAADRLGQLAALFVADVAGGRAHQPGHGVFLHVLGHVDPDHRLLGVEHELRQGARQLGLAHPGGSEEQEGADRPVGVRQARRVSGAGRWRRPRSPRPGRRRVRAGGPPCAAASRFRPRAAGSRGSRSSGRPPRRRRPRRPPL